VRKSYSGGVGGESRAHRKIVRARGPSLEREVCPKMKFFTLSSFVKDWRGEIDGWKSGVGQVGF
jgi:hypothetical protein